MEELAIIVKKNGEQERGMKIMKKLLAIFVLFALCGVCLFGCNQVNRFDNKIEKVLVTTKEYVNECDIKDFYHVYDLLKASGEEIYISVTYYKEQLYSSGQPLNSDEYSKEFQDELLQLFQKYPWYSHFIE